MRSDAFLLANVAEAAQAAPTVVLIDYNRGFRSFCFTIRRAVANRNRYLAHIAQLQVRGVMWVTRRSFVERAARTERVVSFAGYSAGACG